MRGKIIFWTTNIDNLVKGENSGLVGGITVQMYMWSKTFVANKWTVYTFTKNRIRNQNKIEDINFIYYPYLRFINPILSLLFSFLIIIKLRPNCIFIRGATRDLLFLTIISKFLKIRLIHLFASDSDLNPGKELIKYRYDKYFYRMGLKLSQHFVIQNEQQAILLMQHYKISKYLLIPNIWCDNIHFEKQVNDTTDVLTPQIAGHNLINKLGLIKFGNYDKNTTKFYT